MKYKIMVDVSFTDKLDEAIHYQTGDIIKTKVDEKRRENIVENHFKNIEIINDESIEGSYIINSISAHGDVVGLVIILSTENQVGQLEEKIANITSSFLSKYLEE